jgi:TRAP-type C4-dicarboxylate transport system permease small subunit
MRGWLDRLYAASGWFAALNVVAIAAVVLGQVALNIIDRLSVILVSRPFGLVIPSYAELAGFFLAAASFAALASTWRSGGHIRVTMALDRLGRRGRRALDLWSHGVAALVAAFFTGSALVLVQESWHYGDVSPGLVPVPLWLPQSAMALGLALLTVAVLDGLIAQFPRRDSPAGCKAAAAAPGPSRAAQA